MLSYRVEKREKQPTGQSLKSFRTLHLKKKRVNFTAQIVTRTAELQLASNSLC